jgi:hypothetical protein
MQHGALVSSSRKQYSYHVYEHFGIKKQILIRKNDGNDFEYWRNFPIPEYETKHILGHLHYSEYDLILEIKKE